jgi:hypothetical protein
MSEGRTSWWPRDAAEHERELLVELAEEFGPAAHAVAAVIKDLAQAQRDEGNVRTGFRVLAAKCHLHVGSTSEEARGLARTIIERAGGIGWLDDLAIDEDGRRFSARVSGWNADQARGRESIKKATQRARPVVPEKGDMSPSNGDMSPLVPPTIEVTEKNNTAAPAKPATVQAVPDALPDDLPTLLYAGALQAHAALNRIAASRPNARPVTLAAVGRAVASFPTHDHAQIAGDVEHYWCHGIGATKPIRDVVQTYRNRLGALPAPAATTGDGTGASVHQITETAEQRRKRLVEYANRRNAELGLNGDTPA